MIIGVMARAPIVGRCKTRLAATIGAAPAAALYRAMLLDTLGALERAAADMRLVIVAAPEDDGVAALRAVAPARWEIVEQHGDGLGPRLSRAVETLSHNGEPVALVSSDSPTAPWLEASKTLRLFRAPKRALMGPCDDGGYWLIAATPDVRGIFEDIAWSTPLVQEHTRSRCRSLGLALDEIATAYDIDDARDLDRLTAELRASPERAPLTAAFLEAKSRDHS